MFPELLFGLVVVLLPIAALSGWYYGRKSTRSEPGNAANGLSQDYFKGLNYLLNDRPDKAIEIFVKVLEVDSDTVETHLALGNLFRRRGEVDRAIRIHQNLIARPALDREQRGLALLELGLDYMRSGLFDRAESLFKELLQMGLHERQVLRHLVDIYQQEQGWDEALDHIRRLERITGEDLRTIRAHFYCEKALLLKEKHDSGGALRLLDRALKEDRKCVRARLLSADLLAEKHDYAAAIKQLRRVEHQDIDFLPEAIPRLVACYSAIGRLDDLASYLETLSELHTGITPVLVLAELTAERRGLEAAKNHIVNELRTRPTIRGIDRLIEYALADADGETREDLALLKETTRRLVENRLSYQCATCGFSARQLHWQCPGCKSWSTIKPIQGIEGE